MARRGTAKPVQLTLDQARKPTGRGGWRPGAGRPRGRTSVGHITRERFAARFPLHVTLRVAEGVGSLRKERVIRAVRAAITTGGHGDAFRVVEFAVLAESRPPRRGILRRHPRSPAACRASTCASRGGSTRPWAASGASSRTAITPAPFAPRARSATCCGTCSSTRGITPRSAARRCGVAGSIPCSSGAWFDGWNAPLRRDVEWLQKLTSLPRPTAAATTWLLTQGWRRSGLLGFDEVPAT